MPNPADYGATPILRPEDYGAVALPGQIGAIARKQALTPTKPGEGITEYAPLVGGTIGGLVVPGAGAIPGAMIGAEIGTIAKQVSDVSEGKPVTTPGLLGEQALNVGAMGAGEAAGRYVLSPVMEKILGAASRGIQRLGGLEPRPGAAEAQRALQTGGGGSLSVAQAVKGTLPELGEKVGRLGVFGRPIFEQLDETNQASLKAARDKLVAQYSTVPPEMIAKRSGTLFQNAVSKGEDAFQSAAKGWYDAFDAKLPIGSINRVVDMRGTKQWAADEILKYQNIGKKPPQTLLDIRAVPDAVSFGDAQFARSLALKSARDLSTGSSKDSASLAYLSQYQGRLLKAMDEGAQKLGPDLFAEYRRISDAYRRGSTAFGNDIILDLVSKHPEEVADHLYQSGNIAEIVQAKATLRQAKQFDQSIDTDRVWKNLQASYLTRLFSAPSARGAEGEVVGKGLSKTVASEKNFRTMSALFDPQQAAQIKSVFDTARIVQAPAKHGNLELAIPIGQGAAISALAYGAYVDPRHRPEEVAGAAAILLAPRILAKLMTNPETVNMLLQVGRMSPRDPKIIPLLTKIGVQREVAELSEDKAP